MQERHHDGHDLLDFVEHVSGDAFVRVEEDLGEGFVRLNVVEAERRQAKHDIRSVEDIVVELLRNSRDSNARNIFIATTKDAANQRFISIIDDGEGVPPSFKELIFEPRVTTKLDRLIEDRFGIHGRGMALYAMRQRAKQADLVYSSLDQGSSFKVIVDVTELKERNDQSTYPTIEIDEDGQPVCKGINNIPRMVIEFALATPEISYYLGSPTEILATMFALSLADAPASALDRYRDGQPKPLWSLAGSTRDVKSLATLSERFYGLQLSERNMYRVINKEITPLEAIRLSNYKNVLKRQGTKSLQRHFVESHAKLLQDEDIEYIGLQSLRALNVVGSKYFLRAQKKAEVKREGDKLKIVLFLEKTD